MSLSEEEPLPVVPTRRRRVAQRVQRVAIDITPLRVSPEYRRFYAGESVSEIGTQMTLVAMALQVDAMTRSAFAVGLTGLVAFVALVSFGLIGGAIADAVDRRRLLLVTHAGLVVVSGSLLLQAALGNTHVSVVYVLVFLLAALFSVAGPARRALTPSLLPAEHFAAAAALGQLTFNFAVIAGPLLAGIVVATAGVTWVYGVDVVSFVAVLYAAYRLPVLTPEGGGRKAGVDSVLEGMRFLRTRRNVLMTFLVDVNAMVFGMPRALFPVLARTVYGGGPRTAGLLYASPAVGAFVGALLGGWFSRVRMQGRAVLAAVAVWGLAIAAFGLADALWLACLMLALAGAADMVSAVFRTAILNAATPDELRGRLSGIFIVVVAGGPRLGDLEAGAVGSLVSPQFAVVSGGLACLVGVVALAAFVPSFARYDARDPTP